MKKEYQVVELVSVKDLSPQSCFTWASVNGEVLKPVGFTTTTRASAEFSIAAMLVTGPDRILTIITIYKRGKSQNDT